MHIINDTFVDAHNKVVDAHNEVVDAYNKVVDAHILALFYYIKD